MIFCNKCGKENSDSSKFCTGCGNKIFTPVQHVAQPGNTPAQVNAANDFLCTQCGKQNKEHARFCVGCGNKLEASVPQVQQQEPVNNDFLCTQCGKQNRESDKFCLVCGNKLGPSLLQDTTESNDTATQEPLHTGADKVQPEDPPAAVDIPVIAKEEGIIIPSELKSPVYGEAVVAEDTFKQTETDFLPYVPLEEEKPVFSDEPLADPLPLQEEIPPVAVVEKKPGEQEAPDKAYQPNYGSAYSDSGTMASGKEIEKEEIRKPVYTSYGKETLPEEDEEEIPDIIPLRGNNYAGKKRRKVFIVTTGILLLAGLCVAAFYIFDMGTDSSTSNMHDAFDHISTAPVQKKDSVIPSNLDNIAKMNDSARITNPKTDTTSTVVTTKPDNFRYLSVGQIKNDLMSRQLCDGLVYTGQGQSLSVTGFFPDTGFQKNLADNGSVTVNVNFRDLTENKSCTVEVFYRKNGNKFSFENYAEK